MTFYPAALTPPERAVLERAVRFKVAVYLGRGVYDRGEALTLPLARRLAVAFYDTAGGDQPAVIYAIDRYDNSALVETYDPRRRGAG